MCPWQRPHNEGVHNLFKSNLHPLQVVDTMFNGVERLAQPFVSRPTAHNWKRGINGACGIVGRLLPSVDACALHQYTYVLLPLATRWGMLHRTTNDPRAHMT